jgi:AcrR family transcriptional regulator
MGEDTQAGAGAADAVPRKRRRDPEVHRAAILDAARAAFAERGLAKATIRDVARRAGVTHGLVMRHFTSRERLFVAAMPGSPDLAENVVGDLEHLPDRIARAYVERMTEAGGADPFVALIRSAASDEDTAKRLLTAMRDSSLDAYRTVLDLPDTENRVELLAAHLVGVTFIRYVLKAGPLATMAADRLTRYLADDLRAILFSSPDQGPGQGPEPGRTAATAADPAEGDASEGPTAA